MEKLRLLADIDDKLVRELKKRLIDEKLKYKEWLTAQIKEYLKKKGKGKNE